MFSINQTRFTFHDNCCWITAATHMAFNNILKRDITQDDIEDISHYVTEVSKIPMADSGANIFAGMNRIIPRLQSKGISYMGRKITFGDSIFEMHLNEGKLIGVNIHITEAYQRLWKSGKKIEGDFTTSPKSGGHVFCIFRKDGIDYLLNSGDPEHNVREIDLKAKGLFKSTKCGILY